MKPEDVMSKEDLFEACKPTPAEQIELDKMAADIQTAMFKTLENIKTPTDDEILKKQWKRIYEDIFPDCKIEIEMDETPLSDEDRKARKSKPMTVKIYPRVLNIDIIVEK
jgi:hypothetical protein